MENKLVSFQSRGPVCVLTLSNPPVNSLSNPLVAQLDQMLDVFLGDDSHRVLIITGEGEKAFSAGADIAGLADMLEGKKAEVDGNQVYCRIENSPKPVIAAINGIALGGGLELALSCHLRIAGQRARFGLPEVTLGIIPGWGGTHRLPRIIGKGRALELMLFGSQIKADAALAWGLVNAVVPQDELLQTAGEWAERLAAGSASAQGAVLRAVRQGADQTTSQAIETERLAFADALAHPDAGEGLEAFLNKRAADFR